MSIRRCNRRARVADARAVAALLLALVPTVALALSNDREKPANIDADSFRTVQGLGVGGLGVLGQIVLAEILSPLERGKYMGIMGAIMAVATVGGPLIGGLFTDTIGWRWNFYVAVPFAVVALIMLQLTLHLTTSKRKVKLDYAGAVLISAGFSSLLIWITLVGGDFLL